MSVQSPTTFGSPARPAGSTRDQATLGVVLAAIGAIFHTGFVAALSRYQPIAIGVVTLVAFAVTRAYAYAVPAGILLGIGSGVLLVGSTAAEGDLFLLAMSAGFVGVWVLGLFAMPTERHPWPLVPAAVIGAVGVIAITDATQAYDLFQLGTTAALVVAGIIVIGRTLKRA